MSICQLCHTRWDEAKESNISFHRFPVANDAQCLQWLQFCGLQRLYGLSKGDLHRRRLCSRHFQRVDFFNIESGKRLIPSAVPSIGYSRKVSSVGKQVLPSGEALSVENLSSAGPQHSKPRMGYDIHKTDSAPDASEVSVEERVSDSKNEVDCIVHTPPSPCPKESPPSPFTLHNDIANLQLDLNVLRELKEGMAALSKKLRDQLDATMVRVHQLISKCREDQKLALAECKSTPEMELESQRLKRLSLYLSMVLTFLRKWKEDEVKEIYRYIHIEQRMNWLNKLAIVVVNKDPNELEKALKIAENMT